MVQNNHESRCKYLATCSSLCSHRSLIHLLRTARFLHTARLLRTARLLHTARLLRAARFLRTAPLHSFIHSLAHSLPSSWKSNRSVVSTWPGFVPQCDARWEMFAERPDIIKSAKTWVFIWRWEINPFAFRGSFSCLQRNIDNEHIISWFLVDKDRYPSSPFVVSALPVLMDRLVSVLFCVLLFFRFSFWVDVG